MSRGAPKRKTFARRYQDMVSLEESPSCSTGGFRIMLPLSPAGVESPPGREGRDPVKGGRNPCSAALPSGAYLENGRSETRFRFPLFHLPGRHVLSERRLRPR